MQTDEQILLSEYKKYDYLNSDSKNPLIKIFVSYIKPSFLFKSEILTPIHLGRAVAKENSKDGVISDADLEWLYKNCIGDDDFEENISSVNRRVGFLTGTWWAYKNYEKLGNPEYFGSFGYRKLFASECLEDLKKYAAVIPCEKNFAGSLKEQFTLRHGKKIFEDCKNVIKKLYPNELQLFEKYFQGNKGYFCEIYIMKKNIFFNFCKWIFPILQELLNTVQDENQKNILNNFRELPNNKILKFYDNRLIGFAMERITGYYLYKLINSQNEICKKSKILVINDKNTNEIEKEKQKTLSAILRQHIKEGRK